MRNTSYGQENAWDFIFSYQGLWRINRPWRRSKTCRRDIFNLLSEKDKTERHVYIREPHLLQVIADRFKEALSPLNRAEKLGVIVFQFPPWFYYKTAHMDYILNCKELMQGLPVAVEFRHGSWLTSDRLDSLLQFLRKHQLTYITADEPQYANLATVPFLPNVTTEIAYFRFHGKNSENWLKKGIETSLRVAYLYADEELKEFVPSIQDVDKKARSPMRCSTTAAGLL
jgi:uncharacterized protein YecE (DUF72 family)